MVTKDFTADTKSLIDNLKGICASYGLGNDGNEFKIITQVFLYKFMNDKFAHEAKTKVKNPDNWQQEVASYSDEQYGMLLRRIGQIMPN
jgi:type I restriction enzyme M protein